MLWPALHWTIAITVTVVGVELLYFLAPFKRPKFINTLPGAVLTVGAWLVLSSLLGIYFRHFANYSRIYGTLGDSRCTVDKLTQRPLKQPGAYRIEARGFCTQPAHAVRGKGDILVSTFEFAGPVNFPAGGNL